MDTEEERLRAPVVIITTLRCNIYTGIIGTCAWHELGPPYGAIFPAYIRGIASQDNGSNESEKDPHKPSVFFDLSHGKLRQISGHFALFVDERAGRNESSAVYMR